MAISTYNPPATKIVHWTGVDFNSRPTSFAPIHLVQYDQRLPIIAVNLYNNGQSYVLPANINANILVEKKDGTFVSNPTLGCNSERNALYFEATYQMLYFPGTIKPVVELKMSDLETGASSSITIIVDRNPVQENSKESSNEYKSVEQFMNTALEAKNQAVASATSANQSKSSAAQSAQSAATSAQNAKDYLTSIEAMTVMGDATITDSNGNAILDSNGKEITGMYLFASMVDLQEANSQIFILFDRNHALESRINELEKQIIHAIFDSGIQKGD